MAAILDFQIRGIFYWLTMSGGPSRTILPDFVTIGQLVAKILRFFDFSRWRPSAILDLFAAHLDNQYRVLGGLYHSAKFDYVRCGSFHYMNVSIFVTFGWKIPIHTSEIVFFGNLIPLHWLQYQPKTKRHTLA